MPLLLLEDHCSRSHLPQYLETVYTMASNHFPLLLKPYALAPRLTLPDHWDKPASFTRQGYGHANRANKPN